MLKFSTNGEITAKFRFWKSMFHFRRHLGFTENFREAGERGWERGSRIGKSSPVPLGCPSNRYYLGTTPCHGFRRRRRRRKRRRRRRRRRKRSRRRRRKRRRRRRRRRRRSSRRRGRRRRRRRRRRKWWWWCWRSPFTNLISQTFYFGNEIKHRTVCFTEKCLRSLR